MTEVRIPIKPKPSDHIEVSLENIAWQIYYRWSYGDHAWYMDMSSVQTGTTLKGLKLVPMANLLQPHAVTELGKIFVVDTEGKYENPDYDNIGDRYKVVYIPKADVDGYPL